MDQRIYIKKDGLFERQGKVKRKIVHPLSYYFRHVLVLAHDLTVLDLMRVLNTHKDQVDNIFLAYTRGFDFGPFFEEINSESVKNSDYIIDCIEFSWQSNVDNFKNFGKPRYEISEYVHLSGKKKASNDNYSIVMCNLSDLRNATLKLNKNIEYSRYEFGEIWENKKAVKKTFLKGVREFNFENIIGAFLSEISFFGHPLNRNEKRSELEKQWNELDEADFIPGEQVQLDWKRQSLTDWQKKKDSKTKLLNIDKLQKEIEYLQNELRKIGAKE